MGCWLFLGVLVVPCDVLVVLSSVNCSQVHVVCWLLLAVLIVPCGVLVVVVLLPIL